MDIGVTNDFILFEDGYSQIQTIIFTDEGDFYILKRNMRRL